MTDAAPPPKRESLLREFSRRFLPFWAVYFAFGWWAGSKLVAIPNLQAFKVLNVIGLTADLAGIIILSRFVAQNERYRRWIIGPVAEQLYAFFLVGIIALWIRSHHGATGVSTPQMQELSLKLFFFLAAPLSAYLPAVLEKLIPTLGWTEERKTSALGGTLLVFGVLIQIVAAFLDLYS